MFYVVAFFLFSVSYPQCGWSTQAVSLAADSVRAAQYWGALQSGDSVQAESLLDDTGSGVSREWALRANFLAAYTAFSDSDYASVPALLDLDLPRELMEHAEWMRGASLSALGQDGLAGIYWRRLSQSAIPEYRDSAIVRLAADAATIGKLDTLRAISRLALERGAAAQVRQYVDLTIAGFLTSSGRYGEATELLRSVYLLSPSSFEGKKAAKELEEYSTRYGYTLSDPGWEGRWREIERLEDSGLRQTALDKLEALRKLGRYASHDESLLAKQVKLCVALRRNQEVVKLAQQHLKQFPQSGLRDEMLAALVRGAWLTDQDSLAIANAEILKRSGTDRSQVGEAWRLIGLLHIDRDHPEEAAKAFEIWRENVRGVKGEDDALWNATWARFLAEKYEESARGFEELVRMFPKSGYLQIGMYWAFRAYDAAGLSGKADSCCAELRERFPYSYYAQWNCGDVDVEPIENDMRVLSLGQLYEAGGAHARAFAQLVALGIPELAIREWPLVEEECGAREDVAWWRPLTLWLAGKRFESWRWTISEMKNYAASSGERPAEFFRLWYPIDYEPEILALSQRYSVDPYQVFGLINQESHYDDQIVSPSGAIGLMQLMPATAKEQAKRMGTSVEEQELFQSGRNLEIGIAHYSDLLKELNGDSILALCAYNAGINAAKKWQREFGHLDRDMFVERIPYRETRLYVKHILQHTAAYRRLYPYLQDEITTQP